MKKLTKAQQKKILKAQKLIENVWLILEDVKTDNDAFRYDSNTNLLFNSLGHCQSILGDHATEILSSVRL